MVKSIVVVIAAAATVSLLFRVETFVYAFAPKNQHHAIAPSLSVCNSKMNDFSSTLSMNKMGNVGRDGNDDDYDDLPPPSQGPATVNIQLVLRNLANQLLVRTYLMHRFVSYRIVSYRIVSYRSYVSIKIVPTADAASSFAAVVVVLAARFFYMDRRNRIDNTCSGSASWTCCGSIRYCRCCTYVSTFTNHRSFREPIRSRFELVHQYGSSSIIWPKTSTYKGVYYYVNNVCIDRHCGRNNFPGTVNSRVCS